MRLAVLVALLGASVPWVEAGQARRAAPPPATQAADRTAEAYTEFLRARLLEDDDVEGAIAAYKRAMTLDPAAAAIPAGLADLYLRENRSSEAESMAEQALKLSPSDRDAHRILGTLYATLGSGGADNARSVRAQQENLTKAITHLERAIEPPGTGDANLRAMLSSLYVATGKPEKAIPLLVELVKEEPGWQAGPNRLAEAYSAAGRAAEGIAWLEAAAPENPQLYSTLGQFYTSGRRFADAARAYELALKSSPTSIDIRRSLAEALLNTASRADSLRAREVLREAVTMRGTDERSLYLLSEAERAGGDFEAAEGAARRLIAQNARNPQGYSALAEALEGQHRFQPLIDALAPAVATFRGGATGSNAALRLLLPHLGFAYLELGQYDKAVSTFEDARKIAPNNPSFLGFLIQAQMAAKNYAAAGELAHAARIQNPNDVRLAGLESLALRRAGKTDQGLAILEDLARRPGSEADAHLALAQAYMDVNRGPQAVKTLQDAQARFPAETSVAFELGAVYDKLKRYEESEATFRQLIAKEPENASALNYLGYMLAERGERLSESVDFLKRALAIEPENGSFLDSIGWAYFKDGKLDLALDNLKRAADQLLTNSVVQDHYGDVLVKLGRYDAAISAWTRALSGDGDSIDRSSIDKKIRSARQKLPKR